MVSVYLVQQPDGRFVAVDDSGSGDPIAALAQTDAGHILEGIYWEAGWSQGLWAPWRRSHSQTVDLRGLPRHPTDADTVSAERAAAARETFAQWFEQKGSPRYAARVREGTRKRLDFVWWGPVLDAFSVALLVGTLVSAWTTIQSTRAARRAARLRDGSCPACHYDLRPVSDSALEVRCPECGRVWSRQAFGSGG